MWSWVLDFKSVSCSAISIVKEKARSYLDVEGYFVRSLESRFHVNGHHDWANMVSKVSSDDGIGCPDWVVSVDVVK